MRRFLTGFFLITVFFFSCSHPVSASEEFEIQSETTYRLEEDGNISVLQEVSLTNKLPDVYSTEYSLKIEGAKIGKIEAADEKGKIVPEVFRKENEVEIKAKFNEAVVGEGKKINFSLSYQLLNAVVKNGQVWEINLPAVSGVKKSSQDKIILVIPKSFGPIAYLVPPIFEARSDTDYRYYEFNQADLDSRSISAAFGEFQVFDFNLTYHLYNPLKTPVKSSIAIPPDTSFQKVYLEKIEPLPENIVSDQDGNWLAGYRLEGGEKLNISISGSTRIFSQPQGFFNHPNEETIRGNLLPDDFWESENDKIVTLAQSLKSPEKIYRFVVDYLEYDYSKIRKEVQRGGALFALENQGNAICTEFTDLFIALCRAAGIPAREINGFAYTSNNQLNPLGLVSDILHSWPEYWDEKEKIWQPVDPTWEKTTGGRDYFKKFDLNHFAFVIHGTDSQKPLPAGAYKTGTEAKNDIEIRFGEQQPIKSKEIGAIFSFGKNPFDKLNSLKMVITNPGPTATYNLSLKFKSNLVEFDSRFVDEQIIELIPPFGHIEIPIKLNQPSLIKFGKANVSAIGNDQEFSHSFKIESLVWPPISFVLAGIVLGIIVIFGAINFPAFFKNKKNELK